MCDILADFHVFDELLFNLDPNKVLLYSNGVLEEEHPTYTVVEEQVETIPEQMINDDNQPLDPVSDNQTDFGIESPSVSDQSEMSDEVFDSFDSTDVTMFDTKEDKSHFGDVQLLQCFEQLEQLSNPQMHADMILRSFTVPVFDSSSIKEASDADEESVETNNKKMTTRPKRTPKQKKLSANQKYTQTKRRKKQEPAPISIPTADQYPDPDIQQALKVYMTLNKLNQFTVAHKTNTNTSLVSNYMNGHFKSRGWKSFEKVLQKHYPL